MTTLDSVLLAPLEADIPQVVRELCLSLDNFWFSVHLLDLLHHAGALGQAEGDQHGGREKPAQHSHSDDKVLGMRALQSWNSGGAMAWALKSADSKFTTFLADKILVEYSTSGTFSSTDLLDSLDASIVVSDRLTFLGKYREFLKLVEG